MGFGGVGEPESAGGEFFAADGCLCSEPEDWLVGFEEAIGEGVGVVVIVADEVTGGFGGAGVLVTLVKVPVM